ncbi:hypothetical protein ACFY0A_13780 [Streptomyces sp. NPDC001698]|uniref:hypothetical protein n=1 Tax=unclassified Streptomyces TaxID=2593676 RepID=UPI0036A5ECDA
MTTVPDRLRVRGAPPETGDPFPMLPPAPPGILPYITGCSREQNITPRLTHHPSGEGLVFVDETPHDRDSFRVLATSAYGPRGAGR